MDLIVNEIFYSIQGESTLAGLPFVFIRLTGCNLRCHYCDTRYAYDEGSPWQLEDIIAHIGQYPCRRVTITGGEPLFQKETPVLIKRLLDKGTMVSLETNGSVDIEAVDPRCIKIMDVKCPSSGMHDQNRWANLDMLNATDQVKFVIADEADFQYACEKATLCTRLPAEHILFSSAHGVLPPEQLAQWMLDARVEARLQIQLHKYLWPNTERGV